MLHPPQEDSVVEAPRTALLLELAAGLQRVGTPPGRVEHTLEDVSHSLGIRGRFFALPSAVLASLYEGGREQTRLVPAPSGETDLVALEGLRRVGRDVVAGTLSPVQARSRIAQIMSAPPEFGRVVTVLSFGWVSALAALIFGGGPMEAAVAGFAGALIGAMQVGASSRGLSGLLEAGSASVAAFVAATLAVALPHSAEIAVLAALIVLVPGFTIHRALTDLSTGHLLSGSSRMAHAGTVLLLMGFGVALGGRAAGALVGAPSFVEPMGIPVWQRVVALLVMTPALRVLFRAPQGSSLWIAGAVSIAWFGSMGGSYLLGPDLGPFLGALALGLYALLWEKMADRPAALPLAPGLLVLVPGAIGFRGVAALLGGDPMRAVETGFSAMLVATSLVTGLLLANVLVRGGVPRDALRDVPWHDPA